MTGFHLEWKVNIYIEQMLKTFIERFIELFGRPWIVSYPIYQDMYQITPEGRNTEPCTLKYG